MLNRLLLFVMAACLGTLFLKMELPIPYLLGGIFAAVACKIAGRLLPGLRIGVNWVYL